MLGQHVQCVYKDWEKGQWLPTVACAILKQLTRQPVKEDFKRYVDQITQNVIALLHICHFKNLKCLCNEISPNVFLIALQRYFKRPM